jgi:glutaredoxin
MTKKFLKDLGVEYEYIDVDLASREDQEIIRQDIQQRGGDLRYPTIIIDDKIIITGFRKEQIKEGLGL